MKYIERGTSHRERKNTYIEGKSERKNKRDKERERWLKKE